MGNCIWCWSSMRLHSVVAVVLLILLAAVASLLSGCGYNGCSDIPVLESISPTSTAAGGPAFTLTLTGRHFHSDTIFFFGSAELTSTTVSDTVMTANIAAKYIATAGMVEVFVSGIPGGANLGGPCGGGPSNKVPFTIK